MADLVEIHWVGMWDFRWADSMDMKSVEWKADCSVVMRVDSLVVDSDE